MKYVRFFDTIGHADTAIVGGKNASLGEMIGQLAGQGIKVPNGFATTSEAYWKYLDHNDLKQEISNSLHKLDTRNLNSLAQCGEHIRSIILQGKLPHALESEIVKAYQILGQQYDESNLSVSLRSSATAEDLPQASFAGQQESFLNICGVPDILKYFKRIYASLFTDRAISYRVDQGFDHMKIALSVGIQKMVRSDLACSGVMFSIDTETGFKDAVFITGAYGLGENVVQGTVQPDEAYVFKPLLNEGYRSILKRTVGEKAQKMVYAESAGLPTHNIAVPKNEQQSFCLSEDELLELAKYAVIIESHYSAFAGQFQPMDIEWAKDGKTNELFIVQARPETVHSRHNARVIELYKIKKTSTILCTGRSVGSTISAGVARVIKNISEISQLNPGEILVTEITDPDWEPIMKIAAGIVTNRGGRTCHAAIISRELGLTAVVGTENGTEKIKDGDLITVSCAEGETGNVYDGKVEYSIDTVDVGKLDKTKTKVMMNVANPDQAFSFSKISNDGVGLARVEFIINNFIGIHPNAILKMDELTDTSVKQEIMLRARAYNSPTDFYIKKLAEGISTIAAAFYPKKVIFRLSDFKSNEYSNLLGGHNFEPVENNPMIGIRGACRYYSKQFKDAFSLECKAVKLAREEKGLKNIKLMIPFVRTPLEGKKVLALMNENDLIQGVNELEIYVMCEIPANVLQADELLNIFDGFSIGSNDLTQLTLGVDRDSELLASVFDERNEAVLELIKMAISACKRKNKYVGICGQAPSDFPEFVDFLVQQKIDSLSLNPDSVIKTTMEILKAEKKYVENQH